MEKDMIDDNDGVKIILKKIKSIYGRSLIDLIHIFNLSNYDFKIAGESVRDLLMNTVPKNIELVSSATIPEMKEMFTNRNVATINCDNEQNGIITTRFANNNIYKIATICPDLTKFGFTSLDIKYGAWEMNAYSRIFTVNSMFLDFDGQLLDYFNGHHDIMSYRVRMNDDPNILIKEDYIRILLYFKTFGQTSNDECDHDFQTLDAIKANINGLESVNGELIWSEMKMILRQRMRGKLFETFIECGGASCLGLPSNLNFGEFREVTQKCDFPDRPLLGISYLCAFLKTREDVMKVHQRLRLSTYERDLAIFLVQHKNATRHIDDFVYYKQMCLLPFGANRQVCKEFVLEMLKYNNKKMLFIQLMLFELPSIPIGRSLFQSNGYQHQEEKTKDIPSTMQEIWCLEDLELTSNELLDELPMVLQHLTKENFQPLKKKYKNIS